MRMCMQIQWSSTKWTQSVMSLLCIAYNSPHQCMVLFKLVIQLDKKNWGSDMELAVSGAVSEDLRRSSLSVPAAAGVIVRLFIVPAAQYSWRSYMRVRINNGLVSVTSITVEAEPLEIVLCSWCGGTIDDDVIWSHVSSTIDCTVNFFAWRSYQFPHHCTAEYAWSLILPNVDQNVLSNSLECVIILLCRKLVIKAALVSTYPQYWH